MMHARGNKGRGYINCDNHVQKGVGCDVWNAELDHATTVPYMQKGQG